MLKLTIATIITVLGINSGAALYPETMVITDITADTVTAETATGYAFSFCGSEDYTTGDIISCIMSDNATEDNITDDIIVSAQYSGFYIEQEELKR